MKLSTRSAAFQPKTVNATHRTVDVIWTTGAKVLRHDAWEGTSYYEELSLDPSHVLMGRLNNGAPFLNMHDSGRQIGVVESARLEAGQGVATIRFPTEGIDAESDKTFRLIQEGIIQNISVGYRVHKFEKHEAKDNKIPTYRAVSWEPYEISAVSMGADDGAGFRSAQGAGVKTMENETPELVETDVVKKERARGLEIQKLVRGAQLGDDLAQRFIEGGTSINEVRKYVCDVLAKRSDETPTTAQFRVEIGESDTQKWIQGASNHLIERSGVSPDVKSLSGCGDSGGQFRGQGLMNLARESLERRGVRTRGWRADQIVSQAFIYRTGMSTTSDFATLLETTMNKTLLGAYLAAPNTWQKFCGVKEVSDFRDHSFYRVGSLGSLDPSSEHGELKHKAIPDGTKVSVRAETYGNIIAITRKAIINDDMDAFTTLLQQLGEAAQTTIEEAVYAMLLEHSGLGPTFNGSNFFDASKGNVNATGSALTVAGIDADAAVMEAQKDPNNKVFIDVQPKILLVPRSLRGTALTVNEAEFDHDGSAFEKPNTVRGLFSEVVASPRLTGTRRYLFADPNRVPAFVVSFLEGQKFPTMESQDGWNILGTEMRVVLDFGLDPFDPKGAVTNAGAP